MKRALFLQNYPSGTGYAWETIERVFRALGERLHAGGWEILACYPSLAGGAPRQFADSPVRVIESPDSTSGNGLGRVIRFCRLLRRERIDLLYLTDQATRSWRYIAYRVAGVRWIVVHDRTSGERTRRTGIIGWTKRLLHRIPWYAADMFVGVSDFVVRRLVEVNGAPPERTHRVYNGIDLDRFAQPDGETLQQVLGLPDNTQVVFASSRAMPYKGIPVLLEAAQHLEQAMPATVHVAYAGDGPALDEFRRKADGLGLTRMHFLGRRTDVAALLASAAVVVVPSVWAEAFGLTVAEAMAGGRPLVATRTGGIPELVEPGRTGLLVPPGDSRALAAAIEQLLGNPDEAAKLGTAAQAVARNAFSIDRVARELETLIGELTAG